MQSILDQDLIPSPDDEKKIVEQVGKDVAWVDRRRVYEAQVKEALDKIESIFGQKMSIHIDLMVDGHHQWFDPHVLSVTERFIRTIAHLRTDPIDETTWEMVRAMMKDCSSHEIGYRIKCDAENNPCFLVDKGCVHANFYFRAGGREAIFSLTVG